MESAPQQSFPNGLRCELFFNSPKERNDYFLTGQKVCINSASPVYPYEYNIVFLTLDGFTIRKILTRRKPVFLTEQSAFLEEIKALIRNTKMRGAFPVNQKPLSDHRRTGGRIGHGHAEHSKKGKTMMEKAEVVTNCDLKIMKSKPCLTPSANSWSHHHHPGYPASASTSSSLVGEDKR